MFPNGVSCITAHFLFISQLLSVEIRDKVHKFHVF